MAKSGEIDTTNQDDKGSTVNTRDLEKIIRLSQRVQLNYMSDPHRRHRMPPGGFKRPGGREWLWYRADVLAWLESGKRAKPPVPPPPSPSRDPGRPKGSLGKKRRLEQIEAAKAGLQPCRLQEGV